LVDSCLIALGFLRADLPTAVTVRKALSPSPKPEAPAVLTVLQFQPDKIHAFHCSLSRLSARTFGSLPASTCCMPPFLISSKPSAMAMQTASMTAKKKMHPRRTSTAMRSSFVVWARRKRTTGQLTRRRLLTRRTHQREFLPRFMTEAPEGHTADRLPFEAGSKQFGFQGANRCRRALPCP